MASAKGLVLDMLGRLVTRSARASAVRDLGHGLRVITLVGPELRDVAWTPGDKVQVLLPTRDVRTYTPSRWEGDELELVAFDHGDAPGSAWSRAIAPGDALRFVGPQRSVRRHAGKRVVLFGDETSFGLAVAFSGAPLASVFEIGAAPYAEIVAGLGVADAACVVRAPGDRHLVDVAAAIADGLRTHPGAELVMTGRAQSIRVVRDRLRTLGVGARPANKAYWSVGKSGLD